MDEKKLGKILKLHEKWLENREAGKHADLKDADLRGADLHNADLRYADLQDADLRGANLQGANLQNVDFRYANLQNANLQNVDLRSANLRGADLIGADLRGANLNFSSVVPPLEWTNMILDDRIAKQFFYYALSNMSKNQLAECLKDPVKYANGFHRIDEVGRIKLP